MDDFYNSHRHHIAVSADDFGISPRANNNTLHLVMLGKINRVGVMAYGKISDEEIRNLAKHDVKLDIHLDILHKFHDSRSKRKGVFLRGIYFLAKLTTGKISSKKIESDWRLQIEKFREKFGKNPDGINSHEHIHFFPPFFKIALKLQEEYSIPYIRFGDSVFMLHNKPVAHILHWLRIINRKRFLDSGFVSSGSFISLDWIDDMDKFSNALPNGTIEIACHPERLDEFEKIKKYF